MTVANSLKEQATVKNMTINHFEQMFDNHKCCENMLPCCVSGYWFKVSETHCKQSQPHDAYHSLRLDSSSKIQRIARESMYFWARPQPWWT